MLQIQAIKKVLCCIPAKSITIKRVIDSCRIDIFVGVCHWKIRINIWKYANHNFDNIFSSYRILQVSVRPFIRKRTAGWIIFKECVITVGEFAQQYCSVLLAAICLNLNPIQALHLNKSYNKFHWSNAYTSLIKQFQPSCGPPERAYWWDQRRMCSAYLGENNYFNLNTNLLLYL